jgi:PAS domain S-box-containing protein
VGLSWAAVAAVVFAVWEFIQQSYFQHLDPHALQYLYITRGIALASCLLAWAACLVLAHRRVAFEQLRRSELKYRQLIEQARDALVVFDPHGIVLEWNPQASRLFGYTRDEVMGRPLPTLPPETQGRFLDSLERLTQGREEAALKYAGQRVAKGGETLDVSLSLFPLWDAQGRVTSFLETVCDIRTCNQLVRKLQQVEKISSMGQLAAGVAHQLNTPLASALLRAQMLEEDVQHPEQVEDLRFIQRQLRYGKEIVEGLLRFSRPSGETQRAEPLNPILRGVVAMLEPGARCPSVRITLDLEATAGTLVNGSRNELEQVFFNLGSNALDAMPQGGELTLATRLLQGQQAEVQVRDTGTGIPQDRLPRIFEPFYTTKEAGKGTGLGLAICWRIVEEARGSIDVASEVGRGTTFRVRLPVRQG